MTNKKLDLFINELIKWNKVHKFTNYKTKKEIKTQIEDSLFPLKYIQNVGTALDIGTGAGFPGLILAIVMEQCHWNLIEPLKKRYSFLNYIKIKLNLKNVSVIPSRLEKSSIKPVELITTRAVMSTEKIITISKPYLKKNGTILLYKGSNVFDELQNIKADIITKGNRNYIFIKDTTNG